MFKKIGKYLLSLALVFASVFGIAGCGKDDDSPTISYTVTEEEWRINFNLTKGQNQPQALSDTKLAEITSYTIYAQGENYGESGTCTLKVDKNGMSIDFYLEGVFREDESGTYESSDDFYIGLTASIMSYFPFADNYNDFTFDETKKAYVAQNLTSAVINENDINETYDMYTRSAEVTFINGYLNTISVELCEDNTFTEVFSSFVFTFSNVNSTTVEI